MKNQLYLYEKDATDFNTTIPIKCYGAITGITEATVTENIDGTFELEFTITYDSNMIEYIQLENIVVCKASKSDTRNKQAFRIASIDYNEDRDISVTAYHISYDLNYFKIPNAVFPFRNCNEESSEELGNKWGQTFWDKNYDKWIKISSGEISEKWPGVDDPSLFYPHLGPWIFTQQHNNVNLSDCSNVESIKRLLENTNKEMLDEYTTLIPIDNSVRSVLLGTDGEGVYDILCNPGKGDGEQRLYYEWDNWTIKLKQRGYNQKLTLRYGRNISSYTQDKDLEEVYCGVIGIIRASKDDKKSDESYVEASVFKAMQGYEDIPCPQYYVLDATEDATVETLDAYCQAWMDAHEDRLGKPNIGISVDLIGETVDFYDNGTTIPSGNATLELCDFIEVYFPSLASSYTSRITNIQYDVLADRTTSIDLGNADSFKSLAFGIKKNKSMLERALNMTSKLKEQVNDTIFKSVSNAQDVAVTTVLTSGNTPAGVITVSAGEQIGVQA